MLRQPGEGQVGTLALCRYPQARCPWLLTDTLVEAPAPCPLEKQQRPVDRERTPKCGPQRTPALPHRTNGWGGEDGGLVGTDYGPSRPKQKKSPQNKRTEWRCILNAHILFLLSRFSLCVLLFHHSNVTVHQTLAPAAAMFQRQSYGEAFHRHSRRKAGNRTQQSEALKITRKGKKTLESLRPTLLPPRKTTPVATVSSQASPPSQEPSPLPSSVLAFLARSFHLNL